MNKTETPIETGARSNHSFFKKMRQIFNGFFDQSKRGNPADSSRRNFMKYAAVGAASIALAPIVEVTTDAEFRAGARAAGAREDLHGERERFEVSPSTLFTVYKKHFGGSEHLLSESAWARPEATNEGEKLRGVGVHLGILAQGCFAAEMQDGEDFDSYYVRFVDSLHNLSDLAGMNFVTLVASLQISAENIAGFEAPKETSTTDSTVSKIQGTLITASRAIGLESRFIELLGPGGVASRLRTAAEARGVETPFDAAIPKEGIRHYDLIRFREQPTTGLMDVEPGLRAEACRQLAGNELVALLERDYPLVYESYVRAVEARSEVTSVREELRHAVDKYLEQFESRATPFAEGDVAVLNAIGIDSELDLYQLHNYTDSWHITSEIPTNPEFAYQRIVDYMRAEVQKDRKAFYKRLFSQQIRNPKFTQYLLRQAAVSENADEVRQVLALQDLVQHYEQQAKQLRIAHFQILKAEGPYEYSSNFQQLTSIITTKSIADVAGVFDPNDQNSLAWHLYKTCAAREIAPIPFLVDGEPFAADITIDPPYAQKSVVDALDTFALMLADAGIIAASPDTDMRGFYEAMEKMYWRDGGVWFGAQPSPENLARWNTILEYFNTKLANRLFYDFTGLLRDEQKITELSQVMLESGLITKSVQDDPYEFFTQFVYVSLGSSHMRRDVSSNNWEKVRQYFVEKILPMVITTKEVSPGVYSKKWNIGSADYPPIFRSQAVLYNFLSGGHVSAPASSSSSDIVGHH